MGSPSTRVRTAHVDLRRVIRIKNEGIFETQYGRIGINILDEIRRISESFLIIEVSKNIVEK